VKTTVLKSSLSRSGTGFQDCPRIAPMASRWRFWSCSETITGLLLGLRPELWATAALSQWFSVSKSWQRPCSRTGRERVLDGQQARLEGGQGKRESQGSPIEVGQEGSNDERPGRCLGGPRAAQRRPEIGMGQEEITSGRSRRPGKLGINLVTKRAARERKNANGFRAPPSLEHVAPPGSGRRLFDREGERSRREDNQVVKRLGFSASMFGRD
jgi:hypothetical protein